MYTPFSNDNADFTNKAHQAARWQVYPMLFRLPIDNLEFESTLLNMGERERQYDGEMAIDRIVKVKPATFDIQPLGFTIQERFRKPKFAKYKDITITEWNPISNKPGELYKLQAQLFMYGYYNEANNSFIDVVVFDVAKTLMGICNKSLKYSRGVNPRTKQPFVTIKFDDLSKEKCLLFKLSDASNYSQDELFYSDWSIT